MLADDRVSPLAPAAAVALSAPSGLCWMTGAPVISQTDQFVPGHLTNTSLTLAWRCRGVLVERSVKEVLPAVKSNKDQLGKVRELLLSLAFSRKFLVWCGPV